jgi:protein dithiol oxidoreductase (disulfide-forming)
MRFVFALLAAASLLAAPAFASPAAPRDGAEYTTLKTPQKTQAAPGKVEVIEFFMYHCPACYLLEPALLEWVQKNADKVSFRRIHLPLTGPNDPEAHMFLALEAMKLEDSLHAKILNTWHVQRRQLRSDEDNIDWAAKNGVDKDKFSAAYNSFGVVTRLKGLGKVAGAYQVNSTPTLIVDGRYLTSPELIGKSNPGVTNANAGQATMQVLDALVAQSRK